MSNKILFATEIPTAHLDELHPLVDWHFAVASECLKDEAYFSWFKNRPRDAKVMLDNGMFEEGKPLSIDELIEVTLALQPEVVFAPDQVGNRSLTLDMSADFYHLVRERGYRNRMGFIPQGTDPEDVAYCYRKFCNFADEFDEAVTYGISFLNDRPRVIEAIEAGGGVSLYPQDSHHFLGMYNLEEVASWPDWVDSCDTIKPFKAAMHGHKLEDCPRGLGKWSTKISIENNTERLLMYRNYAKMHQALTRR